jgi:hypothetical protein
MHPRLTDYWDQQAGAVDAGARRLSALDDGERRIALEDIGASVVRHVEVMDDEVLVQACIPVIDDLYKAACAIDRWDSSLGEYLTASAGTFADLLQQRGLEVQYLVDNAWEDMARPIELFPVWYEACGFVYVCPQLLALELSRADGAAADTAPATLDAAYIAEARVLATELVSRCHADDRHFIHLDTDSIEGSFDGALARRGAAGVLTLFRNTAPNVNTTVAVWYPNGHGESAN